VKPLLVCEVAFAEWTVDEQLRQTTFLGWRDDKSPEEVVIEQS
jgi:bifunctional non-homologous end joining protein LigD